MSTMSDNICIHHTDAERNAWRIGWKWEGITKLESDLSASQQEVRRLREALDKLHIVCETSKPEIYDWYLTDPFASEARQSALEALSSTPAPVQK